MSKSSFAKYHMRENRNNQFRPEQQIICTDLRREFPEYAVLMEIPIFYKKENGRSGRATVDIIIEELGVIYRLNGMIHNSNNMEIHDWQEKEYLEQDGYLVIDVSV